MTSRQSFADGSRQLCRGCPDLSGIKDTAEGAHPDCRARYDLHLAGISGTIPLKASVFRPNKRSEGIMKRKKRNPHDPEVIAEAIEMVRQMTPEEALAFLTYRTPGVEETDMT